VLERPRYTRAPRPAGARREPQLASDRYITDVSPPWGAGVAVFSREKPHPLAVCGRELVTLSASVFVLTPTSRHASPSRYPTTPYRHVPIRTVSQPYSDESGRHCSASESQRATCYRNTTTYNNINNLFHFFNLSIFHTFTPFRRLSTSTRHATTSIPHGC
jgi:hypothetical protein